MLGSSYFYVFILIKIIFKLIKLRYTFFNFFGFLGTPVTFCLVTFALNLLRYFFRKEGIAMSYSILCNCPPILNSSPEYSLSVYSPPSTSFLILSASFCQQCLLILSFLKRLPMQFHLLEWLLKVVHLLL